MLVHATFPTALPPEARLALANAGGWDVLRGGVVVASSRHASVLAAREAFASLTQMSADLGRWQGPPGAQGGRTLGTPAAAARALRRPPTPTRRTTLQVIRTGRAGR